MGRHDHLPGALRAFQQLCRCAGVEPALAQLSLSLSIPAPSEISHCSAVQLKAFLEVLCQEVFQGTGLLFCWKRKASLFLFVI